MAIETRTTIFDTISTPSSAKTSYVSEEGAMDSEQHERVNHCKNVHLPRASTLPRFSFSLLALGLFAH